MPVDERRRLALRAHIAESWGEEAAQTLFELVTPPGQELATRQDVRELHHHIEGAEQRITATVERRITDAITTQTRTLVFSQLGALVTIAALAFGLR
jgi:hypothetical protein